MRLKMSIVPKETIEVIAQSIGINTLSPDVALAVAPDVEYRMRQIMQVSFALFLFAVINSFECASICSFVSFKRLNECCVDLTPNS